MRWCAYPDEVYYLKYAKTGIDIDFYLPSVGLAVQAAYSISGDAREREVGNLKKLAQTSQEAARLVIVTYEEEETIIEDGVTIETVPLYKFCWSWNREDTVQCLKIKDALKGIRSYSTSHHRAAIRGE